MTKCIGTSLLRLLFLLKVCIGQDTHPPAIDVSVDLTLATADAIHYNTGFGVEGRDNRVEINVYDRCKFNEGEQTLLGVWYPAAQATPISFLEVDISQLNAPTGTGQGNVMPWSFLEGIETNTDIFHRYNATYAELFFCVSVELLIDGEVANWDELDVLVPISTVMAIKNCQKNIVTFSMTLVFDPTITTPEQIAEIIAAAVSSLPLDKSCATDDGQVKVQASFGTGRRRLQDGTTEVQVDVAIETNEPQGETSAIDLENDPNTFTETLDQQMNETLGEGAGAPTGAIDQGSVTSTVEYSDGGMDMNVSAQEEVFFEEYEFNFTLAEGALAAYFCDPVSHETIVNAGQGETRQGSVISVCFNVADDDQQFEVDSIEELYIKDAGGSGLSEAIVAGGETVGAGYSSKFCEWTTPTMRTCVASFLLSAAFFEYNAITLGGYGAIRLELGAGGGNRQRWLVTFGNVTRELEKGQTGVAGFEVEPHAFRLEGPRTRETNPSSALKPSHWFYHVVFALGSIGLACFVAY